jgi:hypothetical protein
VHLAALGGQLFTELLGFGLGFGQAGFGLLKLSCPEVQRPRSCPDLFFTANQFATGFSGVFENRRGLGLNRPAPAFHGVQQLPRQSLGGFPFVVDFLRLVSQVLFGPLSFFLQSAPLILDFPRLLSQILFGLLSLLLEGSLVGLLAGGPGLDFLLTRPKGLFTAGQAVFDGVPVPPLFGFGGRQFRQPAFDFALPFQELRFPVVEFEPCGTSFAFKSGDLGVQGRFTMIERLLASSEVFGQFGGLGVGGRG